MKRLFLLAAIFFVALTTSAAAQSLEQVKKAEFEQSLFDAYRFKVVVTYYPESKDFGELEYFAKEYYLLPDRNGTNVPFLVLKEATRVRKKSDGDRYTEALYPLVYLSLRKPADFAIYTSSGFLLSQRFR